MNVRSALLGSKLRILGTVVIVLVVLVGVGFLAGVFGVPTVTGVQNQFGSVNSSTTVIETDLGVNNPNPIGVSLGGASINYTVFMNDVRMASGLHRGIQVGSGNATLNFTTFMQNGQIPRWWYTHIREDEQTQVLIDARVRSSLLGGRTFELPQEKTIETDIIGAFNSEETRPVNANRPVVSDPVLYINETSASWDDGNLSAEQTPIDMSFTVYNPKPYPYTVTEIGYNITMNDIAVGEGGTDRAVVVPPGQTRTITARTTIDNTRLDEWWVSHLQNNQVTQLRIDFSLVVDPDRGAGELTEDVGEIRLPMDPLDYETTIETDMFGTKPDDGSASSGNDTSDSSDGADSGSDGSGDGTSTDSTGTDTGSQDGTGDGTGDETATPDESTPTPTETPTDDGGILDGGSGDSTPTEGPTPTEPPTEEPTPTEPPTETPTDDDGILS